MSFARVGPALLFLCKSAQRWSARVVEIADALHARLDGHAFVLEKAGGLRGEERVEPAAAGVAQDALQAPLPGRVVKVAVREGEMADAGQQLVVLAAMKEDRAHDHGAPPQGGGAGTLCPRRPRAGRSGAGGAGRMGIWGGACPRDGLQSEPVVVLVAAKLRVIELPAEASLSEIETTALVSPRAVPQLADAEELFALLRCPVGSVYWALVPNMNGLERALAALLLEVTSFDALAGGLGGWPFAPGLPVTWPPKTCCTRCTG
jgi:hypothetical protein